jgi:hypothetical protein
MSKTLMEKEKSFAQKLFSDGFGRSEDDVTE